MKDISKIYNLFPPNKGPLNYIGLLTPHIGDSEAEEEVSAFVSKKWTEITPDCWEKNYGALDFFNIYAYYYHLPSIIYHSYNHYEQISLAIDIVINDFLPSEPINKRNASIILQFNHEQTYFISNWLEDMINICEDPEYKLLIIAARDNITYFYDQIAMHNK